MFDHMIDSQNLEIEQDQARFIKDLIAGEQKVNYNLSKIFFEKDWIHQVISSKEVGLDVDRFDYMYRDPCKLGLRELIFYPNIYLENFEIIEGKIVFNDKVAVFTNLDSEQTL